ncbi:MAG: GAF domain-containing SpoIIE family protein phosphatase [Candidatus Krumholzibacteria bacterium]
MGVPFTLLLSVFYLASGIFLFLLGLTILRTGNNSAPTRATALILFFAGVGPILSASSIILQGSLKQDAVVYRSMVDNFEYLWEFYFPALLWFSLTFPRQKRFFTNFVFVGVLVFAPYVFHLAMIMGGDGFSRTIMNIADNVQLSREFSIAGRTVSLSRLGDVISAIFSTLLNLHKQLFLLVNILYASAAAAVLFRSMKLHINPRITGQLRTVLIGLTVSIGGYTLAKVMPLLPGPLTSETISLALINFALVAGGGSVAWVLIRQQFLGIRYVTRRAVLYGGAALVFAVVYLIVVKPVSDFFGQYTVAGKEAFETGFIILTIIAFQPVFFRIEEVLERALLKGRDDLQTKFRELGSEISNVVTEEELERRLGDGIRQILDATDVKIYLNGDEHRFEQLAPILEEIGEPILRQELLDLGEKGRLPGQAETEKPRDKAQAKRKSRERLEAASKLAGGDEVLVPILRDRRCAGFVALGEKTYGLKYEEEELGFLSVIANQVGVALDNVRLLRENVEKKVIDKELQMARRIQSQLLPSGSPEIPGYQLSATTIPSRYVAGDYYDFRVLDDTSLVLVVADVSGKGIPASLLMATLRAAVNSNQDARNQPAAMLRRINTLLYESTSPEEFATVFYSVVDLRSGEIRYANAGHEFPYLRADGRLERLDESGLVLGCVLDFPYEEKSCKLPNGGSLILFTDGMTDAVASSGENFGEDRLRRAIDSNHDKDSSALCAALLEEVRDFSRGGDYNDDLTLVVLKRE